MIERYNLTDVDSKKDYNSYIKKHFGGNRGVSRLVKLRESFYEDERRYNDMLRSKNYLGTLDLLWHIKAETDVPDHSRFL
jgi:hypothetical protein